MVHIVETIITSQIGIFILGMGLTVVPALGIMLIHSKRGK